MYGVSIDVWCEYGVSIDVDVWCECRCMGYRVVMCGVAGSGGLSTMRMRRGCVDCDLSDVI